MYCTNCGKQLDGNPTFCSECGAKIGSTSAAPQPAPSTHTNGISDNAQYDFQQKLNSYRENVGVPTEEIEAMLFAQAVELQTLKAPSTAQFGALEQTSITKMQNGAYLVSGFVDAQNSYGAVVRTNYSLTVINDGSGWKSTDTFVPTRATVPTGTTNNTNTGCLHGFGILLMLASAATDIVSMFMIGEDPDTFRTVLIIGSILFFVGLVITMVSRRN